MADPWNEPDPLLVITPPQCPPVNRQLNPGPGPGSWLAFLGPLAAVMTGLYAVWHVATQPRTRRGEPRQPETPLNWPLADAPPGG